MAEKQQQIFNCPVKDCGASFNIERIYHQHLLKAHGISDLGLVPLAQVPEAEERINDATKKVRDAELAKEEAESAVSKRDELLNKVRDEQKIIGIELVAKTKDYIHVRCSSIDKLHEVMQYFKDHGYGDPLFAPYITPIQKVFFWFENKQKGK